ncbi:putative O-methyltransferase [Mycolicibacterium aubagnense]|uniref:O-methyltransferase n=2 Tax=Mycolicibacterium aubagnense TaxID=319707 RepID=A0ABN5YXH3_9MYCO|nr:putative O-methyltransferase [Mycolicibacterium aubagnense]
MLSGGQLAVRYAADMSSTDDPTVSAGSGQPAPAQQAPAAPTPAPTQPAGAAPAAAAKPSPAEAIVKHAERSITEEPITAAARERAEESGANPITPAVGALLSVLAKIASAKAVVEVGTGAGVSGLWLLSGMRDDGVLTTIDIEPEHQRLAKQAFIAAGVGPSRTRLIVGRAQEVLTRLADESYDLVFIDGEPVDQPQFVAEGVRLLRPGGVIVIHRAALGGRAGDAAANDRDVTAVREATRAIAEDERLTPVLVPLGDGLLAAVRD